jgi:capsular polysaccharide export protein
MGRFFQPHWAYVAQIWVVGLARWLHQRRYTPFFGKSDKWAQAFIDLIEEKGVTDIVLYGDTRPIHASAVKEAKRRGLGVNVLKEGYMRPFWITSERGGTNRNSRLMGITIPQMQNAFSKSDMETPLPPARWGHMRHHVFYGALYHWFVIFRNGDYRDFHLHLSLSVTKEFRLYLARLLLMQWQTIERRIFTLRIKHCGFPYHLALLQLEHDSSLQKHSPFETKPDFLDLVIDGSVKGAPKHYRLVFKAHPLADGRAPIRKSIHTMSKKYGVSDRAHFVRGGKLAQLLNNARTTATVNSTAALQVLWRGIPLKVFSHAVHT